MHDLIVNLYNLMSATDEGIKRLKFQFVMDNTQVLSTNARLFPTNDDEHGKAIRAYANQLIQNFRRSKNLDKKVKELEGLDYSSIHSLFSSNDIIQAILTSAKMNNDYDDEEDYDAEVIDGEVVERGLVEGFSKIGLINSPPRRGGRQSKSLTPTRNRHPTRGLLSIDGKPVLELQESVEMFGNPAGLVVLLGKVARLCDDGHEVSNYIQILYQCSSPQESESTNMKIHVDKAFPSEPSQILYLSYDSVNTSLRNDFTDILALMDVEQDHRNSGNPNYVNVGGHLQESETIINSLIASHGTFGTEKKTGVYLRLPGGLTCNNKNWQGETYADKSIHEDGYLKKYHMTTDIPISEISAGWDIDTTTLSTAATGGTRYYIMWYFPVSGGEGKRIATKVAPKSRPDRAALKASAQKAKKMLGAPVAGGP
jgi:hypothetical protein